MKRGCKHPHFLTSCILNLILELLVSKATVANKRCFELDKMHNHYLSIMIKYKGSENLAL